MQKSLPARPNLDHLRRQAKALLSALESRDADAASTLLNHLPAARGMTADQVFAARFRLADAQSAIARKNGFAGWPHLARHVEQLRSLEGIWAFARLEVDGAVLPAGALQASRLLIDGDRFRTESPEANYEGIFNINVEAQPHEIDIEFVAGPEAGNWNYGIYRLDGDQLEICLDMNGKPRPDQFTSSLGSGRAYETLKRISHARPEAVTGGTAPAARPAVRAEDSAGFEFVESPTLTKLQGDWTPVKIIRDGQDLPSMILRTGLRKAVKNEVRISIGGQTMIHALVRLDESTDPMQVDYYNIDGACKGTRQQGLLKWIGSEICICMAAPGDPPARRFYGAVRKRTHVQPMAAQEIMVDSSTAGIKAERMGKIRIKRHENFILLDRPGRFQRKVCEVLFMKLIRTQLVSLFSLLLIAALPAPAQTPTSVVGPTQTISNPIGTPSGFVPAIGLSQFLGARFLVTSPTTLVSVGGEFQNISGSLFVALVPLASMTSLPVGNPSAGNFPFNPGEVMAAQAFDIDLGLTPQVVTIPFSANLSPGVYGVVFGTGMFGATGYSALPGGFTGMPAYNRVAGSSSFFWSSSPFRWMDTHFPLNQEQNIMITVVPEPSAMAVFALGLLPLLLIRRREKRGFGV